MPVQPLEPRRLYRQIADQLRSLIAAGEWPVGGRLPAERDLAGQLGVSRPSVREALIALEVEGLVAVRPGSGIEVVAREAPALSARLDLDFGPFEIIRARQLVECELAARAALTLDAAGVRALRQTLDWMAADMAQGRPPVRGDRAFHLRIAEAAGNGPLLRTVTELFDERNNPLFEQLGHHFETAPTWRLALAEHQAVIAAIASANADAARAAMHQHLQNSHDRFAGHWPPASPPASLPAPPPASPPPPPAAHPARTAP